MFSRSGSCACCWTGRRRRRSCASLTPRRRPPTWRIACSASSRNGRASATAPWRKRSSRAARTRRLRASSSSRGNCSRAPSRALAASRFKRCTPSPSGCSAFSLSRRMSLRTSTFSTKANSKRLLLEARDAALVELGASSESADALDLVARESGPTVFDALLTEALSRAEIFGAYNDTPSYADALRAPLGLAPGVTIASVEAEMLGGDVGRMRRERWAADARWRQETRPKNCREPSRSERRRHTPSSRPGAAPGIVQRGGRRRSPWRRGWPTNDQRSPRKGSDARGRPASRARPPAPVAPAQARGADA